MKKLKSYVLETKRISSVDDHVQEAFRINQDHKPEQIEHKYFPENRIALREILKKRLINNKNADLNDIDVSKIENMNQLFWGLDPHNIDISLWDVSNVKDMHFMFHGCKNFNCDLSDWNVHKLEDTQYMFYGCSKFEGNGLENWNISNVENMHCMFDKCDSLKNKPSWYKD